MKYIEEIPWIISCKKIFHVRRWIGTRKIVYEINKYVKYGNDKTWDNDGAVDSQTKSRVISFKTHPVICTGDEDFVSYYVNNVSVSYVRNSKRHTGDEDLVSYYVNNVSVSYVRSSTRYKILWIIKGQVWVRCVREVSRVRKVSKTCK